MRLGSLRAELELVLDHGPPGGRPAGDGTELGVRFNLAMEYVTASLQARRAPGRVSGPLSCKRPLEQHRPDRRLGLRTQRSDRPARDYGWLVLWLGVLALTLALTIVVERDGGMYGEAELVEEVQGWAFPGITLSRVVRFLTATESVIPLGAVLAAVLWLRGERRFALSLAVLLLALPLVQAGIKELVDRARPVENGIEIRATLTSASFPSGHVMGATVFYGWLLAYAAFGPSYGVWYRLIVRTACVFLLLMTGFVSVYLGVHWPTDVFGGHGWGMVLLLPALVAGGLWSTTQEETRLRS